MGLIDQMKYVKILYLSDVLEDIRNEMHKDYRCSNHYCESIIGIVKDLRQTIADTSMPNEMDCEAEFRSKFDVACFHDTAMV